MRMKIEFMPYPKTEEPYPLDFAILTQGKVKIWVDDDLVWNEEDYLGSFIRSLVLRIASISEGEPACVEHWDSSGFLRLLKNGDWLSVAFGRGQSYGEKPNITINQVVECNWMGFLKAATTATYEFLEWINENPPALVASKYYQIIQGSLEQIQERFCP